MAQPSAELLLACANQVGESPVWNAGRGVLHWLDIPQGQGHTLHLATGSYSVWQRDGAIGCIAMSDDGGLVAGGAEGFVALTPDGDGFAENPIAPMLADRPDLRLNDGACDRQGRFWSGSMRLAADPGNPGGTLYRLDKGLATPMLDGFVTQNGLAWSPDGTTMYVSDSHPSRAGVWSFDYDIETGTPSNRRLFVDFAGTGGRPDGAAMDAEGGYWIAATDAAKLLRFTPDGQCDAEISVPTAHPTKPCFGGPDLRSLFVTSLRPAKPDAQAGNLFACLTPWQGIAETPYRPVS